MSTIFHSASQPSFLAPGVEFSFYEQRVAEAVVLGSRIEALGYNWYRYCEARWSFTYHVPDWRPEDIERYKQQAHSRLGWLGW